jgi:hypothetical protein
VTYDNANEPWPEAVTDDIDEAVERIATLWPLGLGPLDTIRTELLAAEQRGWKAAVQAQGADTERLDWLSVKRESSWYPFSNQQGEWWIVHRDAKLSVGPEPTLRAAIDAAKEKT